MLKLKMEFSQIAIKGKCFLFNANLIVLLYIFFKLTYLIFQKQQIWAHVKITQGACKIQIHRALPQTTKVLSLASV